MRKRSRTLSGARAGRRPGASASSASSASSAPSAHDNSSGNKATDDNNNNTHLNKTQPPASDSHATEGICRHCGCNIGRFYNLFHKVSGTYYLPALLGSWDSRLRPTAGRQPRTAAPDSELDGWYVRLIIFLSFVRVVGWHRSEGRFSHPFRSTPFLCLPVPSRPFSIIHYPLAFMGLHPGANQSGHGILIFFFKRDCANGTPQTISTLYLYHLLNPHARLFVAHAAHPPVPPFFSCRLRYISF